MEIPHETFAKLTPGPFLLAHLKQATPVRANGRQLHEYRRPTINTGSLTHSNGSAVVRLGDTALVCGVRAEILLASDVPSPPNNDLNLVEDLGLLVPNLELSTGCSPAHLPGNAPSSLAQSLSYRLSSLLHVARLVKSNDLCITFIEPKTEDDVLDDPPTVVNKAYWTLYIDVLCIALDGNAFDAAWLAIIAALRDTSLPAAWWDPDQEAILCSPLASDSHSLKLNRLPIACSFSVFTTASPLKRREEAEHFVLADPDAFEEDVCDETLTIALTNTQSANNSYLKIEKSGGSYIGKEAIRRCMNEAEQRRAAFQAVISNLRNTKRSRRDVPG